MTLMIQDWLWELLGSPPIGEGEIVKLAGRDFRVAGGVLRASELVSEAQAQTREAFAYKWSKRHTFEGQVAARASEWLKERYGDVASEAWLDEHGPQPILLDAGCGASMSAIGLLGSALRRIRYLGVDLSDAVDVARTRFAELGLAGAFVQSDLQQLPLPEGSVDLILSEGVLHHTDDTRAALAALVTYLKPGGRILFYVYRKKGALREFTDDYIRERLKGMSPQEGWAALEPLTKLGKVLGELDVEIDVPERINLLDIPPGPINLQRFFYWHVMKMYYRPELSVDEMNHINFDWYAPRNAHRHTEAEVGTWCADLNLIVEREQVEEAGITIIARKAS